MKAQNYFNQTVYFSEGNTESYTGDYAGYNTSGYIYEGGVCVDTVDTKYFCTIENEKFYAADSIYWNDWNYDTQAGAGTFGMGRNSPIWQILGDFQTKEFDVYMTNFNSWTWAQSDYIATTSNSEINIG